MTSKKRLSPTAVGRLVEHLTGHPSDRRTGYYIITSRSRPCVALIELLRMPRQDREALITAFLEENPR